MEVLTLPISKSAFEKFDNNIDKLKEGLLQAGLDQLVEGVDYMWNAFEGKITSLTLTNPDFRKMEFIKILVLK